MTAIDQMIARVLVLYKGEEGQALAEYGLILGLVAVVAIAALTALGLVLTGQLSTISSAFGGGGSS